MDAGFAECVYIAAAVAYLLAAEQFKLAMSDAHKRSLFFAIITHFLTSPKKGVKLNI